MPTVTLDEAKARLEQLIEGLRAGDVLVITRDQKPIARLSGIPAPRERRLGTMKGAVLSMAPDFDAPLDDFRESMG